MSKDMKKYCDTDYNFILQQEKNNFRYFFGVINKKPRYTGFFIVFVTLAGAGLEPTTSGL